MNGRVRTEPDPRESEARYRQLIERLPDAVVVHARGRVIWVNPAAVTLFGAVGPEELVGLPVLELVHPGDRPGVVARMRRVIDLGETAPPLAERLLRRDGAMVHAEITADRVRLGGQDAVQVVIRDVSHRRAVERALRDSEERFRRAFEHSGLGKALVAPDGRYLRVNRTFAAMLGYEPQELIGRTFAEVTHPDDVAVDRLLLQRTIAGATAPTEREKRYLRRDGETLWARISTAPVLDGGAVAYVIVEVQDITAEREAKEILRRSERRFRMLTENASDLVAIIGPDGRFLYVSPAHERVLGYRPDELLDTDPIALIHPDDREAARRFLAELMTARDGSRTCEHRVRHKAGGWRWMEFFARDLRADPDVGGFILNSRDVTERKVAEAAVRASEARLAAIIGSAMDAIIATDADHRIIIFNAAAERMFGCSAAQAIGSTLDRFLPGPPRASQDAPGETVVRADGTTRPAADTARLTGVRADGSAFPIEATISRIDDGGRAVYTVVVRDVTERQRLEAQLVQAQKMEAVGQLAGGLAHDFNNLLTAILSHADLALMQLEPGSEVRPDLEGVQRAARRAAELTRQLLAFSRKQRLQARPVDLGDVVREARPLLERLLGEVNVLETVLAPDPGAILADAGQLEQVLVNLVVNARDAMPSGGTVTIETARASIHPEQARRADDLPPGEYVRLTVRDTGCGIDPEVMPRIFEPFFTTKPVGQGTGLGLSMVYGIVTQSGGRIRVNSRPGQGTEFTLLFPRVGGRAAAPESRRRTADVRGTETILLVEDEAAVRASLRRLLQRQGYTVLEARHGADALLVWREHREAIDLVVTDVRMPEMGGPELVLALRAQRPDLPVLFISGYAGHELGQLELAIGPGAVVVEKPFEIDELLRAIRGVLASR